ncbi:MAG TPA: GPGG-motif small membrane protein [Actinomycetota bacterium]|nr:GPGG-motif small membrane protein [Actinomycetota bacterium]
MAAKEGSTDLILWVIAAVLVIAGIGALLRSSVVAGVVLIVLGLLVGPGGVSLLD